MTDSTPKPAKPYPGFPLFAHATKRWAKKIRGKLHYFGLWGDWQAALARYQEHAADLHAGRPPRPKTQEITIRDLLNRFLTAKKEAAASGVITPRTFRDYRATTDRIRDVFGLTRAVADLGPEDFRQLRAEIGKTLGLASTRTQIAMSKAVFNFAYNEGLILAPVRFGPGFKPPSEQVIQRARRAAGSRMLEAAEIQTLLAAAEPKLRAMILLGVNCGFGNYDVATLRRDEVDLEKGWLNHPRPKTQVPRRCKLWPETVTALREVYAKQPTPKNPADASLVFLSRQGRPMVRLSGQTWVDSVGTAFWALVRKVGLVKKGRGFYTLRRVFETIGGDCKDQVAVDACMGHADGSMGGVYRQRIDDSRLEAVANRVRDWLFG